MRILGIDFGDKNIGLALSDPLLITAQALGCYHVRSHKHDLEYFRGLVSLHDVHKIVVGLPLSMDGSLGPQAEKAKEFAGRLERSLGIEVILWDERLTTIQSMRILREQKAGIHKKKKTKDQISAALILSSYLESIR